MICLFDSSETGAVGVRSPSKVLLLSRLRVQGVVLAWVSVSTSGLEERGERFKFDGFEGLGS